MSGHVRVRNSLLVEGYSGNTLVAKAVRATIHHDWYIGTVSVQANGGWDNAVIIQKWLPENLQRKLVMAVLKELV